MSYMLSGEKCGVVYFNQTGTVVDESQSYSSKVTENPIEDGSNINDHVVISPNTQDINGVITSGMSQVYNLMKMWQEKDVVTYSGKMSITPAVITNLNFTSNNTNKHGVSFKLTLQKVVMATAKKVAVSAQDSMNSDDMSNGSPNKTPSNKGRQTPKKETTTSNSYNNYSDKFNSKNTGGGRRQVNKNYSGVINEPY